MTYSRADPLRMGLLLAGAICIIPFLQPRHMPPLRAFYDEWLAFALGCSAILLSVFRKSRSSAEFPTPALFLIAFAGYLTIRAFWGEPAYIQSPLSWALYVAFAALIVTLGHDLSTAIGRDRVAALLATCFTVGAVANAVIGILQVSGIPSWLSFLAAHAQGMRATGNVGQANLYANYMAIGVASLAYLYACEKLGTAIAALLGAVIVLGTSLAASRASILYAVAFSVLAVAAARRSQDRATIRLRRAVLVYAGACILAQWLAPVVLAHVGYRVEGGLVRNAAVQGGTFADEASNLRLSAWLMSLRVFANAPLFGTGPDQFPGAAFVSGLPGDLSGMQLWTSPHNLFLHLLCETGLVGTALVAGALVAWGQSIWARFNASCDTSLWWITACVGVELIHSLLEYPLWYAHFLAITAFIMGMGQVGSRRLPLKAARLLFLVASATGAILLGSALASYLRFDLASPAAAGRSLASEDALDRERHSLAELGGGLFAPRAETWLFLAQRLDDTGLDEKIAIGRRVMRLWPSREVICRQALFLELAGHTGEASALLRQARANYPDVGKTMLAMAESAPPKSRAVLVRSSASP